MVWIFWELGVDISTMTVYNKSIGGELTAQAGNPRVKRLAGVAHRIMRVFSLTYKNHTREKGKKMKRDDLISKARMIARIDVPEEGALDESAILKLIAEIADDNDRLEAEVADIRTQYADAFLSGTEKEKDNEEKEEVEEIKTEDFLDL